MKNEKYFEAIKNSTDPDELNNYLIELAQNPKDNYINLVNYFIKNLSNQLLNKIRINLVYLIGEISSKTEISLKQLNFMKNQYIFSDRWERNEIIKSLIKIAKKQKLHENLIELIVNAVKEDYLPLKKNALECLIKIEDFPKENLKNIFLTLNTDETEILDKARKILKREIPNQNNLFGLLNKDEFHKNIEKVGIRSILLTFFNSVVDVEMFRDLIVNSDWKNRAKKIYLDEIDTFEKILLKRR